MKCALRGWRVCDRSASRTRITVRPDTLGLKVSYINATAGQCVRTSKLGKSAHRHGLDSRYTVLAAQGGFFVYAAHVRQLGEACFFSRLFRCYTRHPHQVTLA